MVREMTESRKRKVHSPEFKAKVGLEALKGVKTINEIGQEYELLSNWRSVLVRRPHRTSHLNC